MFIAEAYAQGVEGGALGQFSPIIPLVLIFIIMYFLILRPQRAQMKKHQEMVNAVRRGDTVVTGGGLIGKVSRVHDNTGELEVELAEGVRVRVVRSTLASVRVKGEPVAETGDMAAKTKKNKGKAAREESAQAGSRDEKNED